MNGKKTESSAPQDFDVAKVVKSALSKEILGKHGVNAVSLRHDEKGEWYILVRSTLPDAHKFIPESYEGLSVKIELSDPINPHTTEAKFYRTGD